MSQFHDAEELISHSRTKLETIQRLHDRSVKEQVIDPLLSIEIKNFMENVRSALDYCACALFSKYGYSNKPNPKIYFPYAKLADNKVTFQGQIVDRAIPGLTSRRPDIVDVLSSYQHFGNTGNWLPLFMELTNENKHHKLTPQTTKEYKMVGIRATIPPGGTVEIDLSRIPLGDNEDKTFRAVAIVWKGLEFATTGQLVLPSLDYALLNASSIVEKLSSL